ncbi:putative quinol monooxygenase [uncultured Ilumatobacter sp.]|uniref:putative quinol monooxygenase n=1 Tax=uncultured Ilumatobacter sp. TaxID=879968 RepID=UPI00374FC0A1
MTLMLAHEDYVQRGRRNYGQIMLIVAGSIITESGGRGPFFNAVQPMVSATREEPGCHEYAFTPDPTDDNRVLLYELWEDQAALDRHFSSAHMADWQKKRKSLAIARASIKKYTISSVADLG